MVDEMSVEDYIKAMAERGINREGLAARIKPFAHAHPRQWRESAYLPGQSKEERAKRHRERTRKGKAA